MRKRQNLKVISKKERGITLIALVITIVILIILATVSISIIFAEGGLIDRAQQAKDLTEQATLKEQQGLNSLMDEMANIMAEDPSVPPEEPEDSQEAIEITDSYWDIATLKEEERNIDGYYLIKSNCTIADSNGGTTISSTGKNIIVIDNNVNCSIQGGIFNGEIVVKDGGTLTINTRNS